ncbi:MAG: hypothetical protein K6T75_07335 [Acetobacteraceae bacterium]|nr:hypothetical protein [Acetobacteraceae bacterium]
MRPARSALLALTVTLALLLALIACPAGAQEVPELYQAGTYESTGLYYGVSAYVEVPSPLPTVRPGTYSRCYVEMRAPGTSVPAFIQVGWNVGELDGYAYSAPVEFVHYHDTAGNSKVVVIGPPTPGTRPCYRIEWVPSTGTWKVSKNNVAVGSFKVFPAPGVSVAEGETSHPENVMGPSHFDQVMYATMYSVLSWYPFHPGCPLYADPPYRITGKPSSFFVSGPYW